MDGKGHNQVRTALDNSYIPARIHPAPGEGQVVRCLTIETHEVYKPEQILNALDKAGL